MKIETFNNKHYWIPDHLLKAFNKLKQTAPQLIPEQFKDFQTNADKTEIPNYFINQLK